MNQLWMQGMGRGFNTISSNLSSHFLALELFYTDLPALSPFSKGGSFLFAFLALKIATWEGLSASQHS